MFGRKVPCGALVGLSEGDLAGPLRYCSEAEEVGGYAEAMARDCLGERGEIDSQH